MSGGGSEDRSYADKRWKEHYAATEPAPKETRKRPSPPRDPAATPQLPAYAELHCLSDFSFQRGASDAEELFARAKTLGYTALAITDECSLAGAVRALKAAEETGLRAIVGSEFVLDDGLTFVLLCESLAGYVKLSKLITRARRAAKKGEYLLTRADLLRDAFDADAGASVDAEAEAGTGTRSPHPVKPETASPSRPVHAIPDDTPPIVIPAKAGIQPSPLADDAHAKPHASNVIQLPTVPAASAARPRPPVIPAKAGTPFSDPVSLAQWKKQRGTAADELDPGLRRDDVEGGDSVEATRNVVDKTTAILMQAPHLADEAHADAGIRASVARSAGACDGLLALWIPRGETSRWNEQLQWMNSLFDGRLWIAIERHRSAGEAKRVERLVQLSDSTGIPLVAAGDVHMHHRSRRALQDAMTAIRLGRPLSDCADALFPNGERHLRPREALAKLYDARWMSESVRIAERCRFTMREVKYAYPAELVPEGLTPIRHLRRMVWLGAYRRWPEGFGWKIRHQIGRELRLIQKLGYEAFFLTVEDVVRWARTNGILCQGRGSAANSIVCFCLGITSVGPGRIGMLFERFISEERREPPDIDVDFEHERREEVLQYIYGKYGRERAALAATVIAYRSKSAARDLGMALGFPQDRIEELSQAYRYGFGAPAEEKLRERGFDPDTPEITRLTTLIDQLYGKPRHLSQHVGGFVISDRPLHELVPVENAAMHERSVIQWDKDDLEYLGLLKVDCLALGMLTCIRKCFRLIEDHGGPRLGLADVDEGDAATYAMIRKADTIGTFQIESRAQMAMLPRLLPAHYYHLVIQIAIVRPGPIEGGMVNPYLRGRALEREELARKATRDAQALARGETPEPVAPSFEPPDFMAMGAVENRHHRDVKALLARTCGVPIFQEQVMALLVAAADFSEGEADQLRRSMAAWKKKGGLDHFEQRIVGGMLKNDFSEDYARRIFEQIKGFGSYGFPESHAASFALLAYVSCWLKCRYPAIFACGLLNSLPMGFYGPAQIVADLRRHGYDVRPPDVTRSEWDHRLERRGVNGCADDDPGVRSALPTHYPRVAPHKQGNPPPPELHEGGIEYDRGLALRLGFRGINGMGEAAATRIVEARRQAPFRDVADLVRRARLDARTREALAAAGALHRLAGHRHRAYWDIAGVDARDGVLREADFDEARPSLRLPSPGENLTADYARLGLTLGRHPLAMLRARLRARRCRRSDELPRMPSGSPVRFAGLVTLRQHPEAAKGVTFMTLEDESGLVNVVVWKQTAQAHRRAMLESRLLQVSGRVEQKDGVLHVIATTMQNWNALLGDLRVESRDFH